MGVLAKPLVKAAPFGVANILMSSIANKAKKKSKGMPSLPGQSPLGMSASAGPGASLQASSGQRSYLG
jgi:hypothetical protein